MNEQLSEAMTSLIFNCVDEKIKNSIDNHEWEKLFQNTGSFFIENPDMQSSFTEELYSAFSKENMKKISNEVRNIRGYGLPHVLHDEIYDLLVRYDVPVREAESYTHYFIEVIFNFIEKQDDTKSLELYIGEWRNEEKEYFQNYDKKLNQIITIVEGFSKMKVDSFSIADIDVQIRRESVHKGMNLDFFQVDDEQFESEFKAELKNESIYVVGKSREETIYRILNELKNNYTEDNVLIIKDEIEWRKLWKLQPTGKILVPFFFAESIAAISGNTNIFAYSEDEPCYSNHKIILRRRTRNNIVRSLESIGFENDEACKLVEKTHGLYIPMKKDLFNLALHNKPIWMQRHSGTVIAALLCGKWTESEGDIMIFEELSGEKYDKSKTELAEYIHSENPYIVEIDDFMGHSMQLACVEDAWEELDRYITSETRIWNDFVDLLYEVLIESEPIFDYPFEKHFEASVYAKQPEWSPTLKHGMIRTLIMYADYRGHIEYQRQIDDVVKRILDTITTKERWGYISQYITDLCEASPKAVIDKLEYEVLNTTGLQELFAVNDGDLFTGRHYYKNILWAVEQLIQQKKYVNRAIEWLWKMNELRIKYPISNSPKEILQLVFCAWLNECAISVDDKIKLAKDAVKNYTTAWDIVSYELPNGCGSVCSTLCKPQYREIDEPDILYVGNMNRTYIEYLWICVNSADNDVEKWKKVINHLQRYDEKTQKDVLDRLANSCNDMSDAEKQQIKIHIRELLYRHRYYNDAVWRMKDSTLIIYEKMLSKIQVLEYEYDYLYLFLPQYEFPLLHPVSNTQKDCKERNTLLRNEEINRKFNEFREKKCSIEKLIQISAKNEKIVLGDVLAEFYSSGKYDEMIMRLLLEYDHSGKHAYDYVRVIYRMGDIDLSKLVRKIEGQSSINADLIVNLIMLEPIKSVESCIIANESVKVKKLYWSNRVGAVIPEEADVKVNLWALNECSQFGSLNSFLELLFESKEKLDIDQLYDCTLMIRSMKSIIIDPMTDFYLEKILELLQNKYIGVFSKCRDIAQLEWSCRNILEWDKMKCTQYMMKIDPTIYADMVRIIYKSELDGDGVDEGKRDLANKMYLGFDKAKFCPTEEKGIVNYESLNAWTLKFKKLLADHGQSTLFGTLLGRLLAHSPVDKDGYMPCEAVRRIIEENNSESLKNSYIVEEENKRGVYTPDAGKSERAFSKRYKDNAEAIQVKYPCTAEIYFELSKSYKSQADRERRLAEDE